MPARKTFSIQPATDWTGKRVVLVPIANLQDSFALIEADDYEAICRTHTGTLTYYAGALHTYVKTKRIAHRIARLITGAPESARVKHKNGDKFDCRRENLIIVPVKRKQPERVPTNFRRRDYLRDGIVTATI